MSFRFPYSPLNKTRENTVSGNFENDRIMGIPNKDCDDGEVSFVFKIDRLVTLNFHDFQTNLKVDYDPNSHSMHHICLEETYKHEDVEPYETVYEVPIFYTPVHKCMNESINYPERIPTLGYHRPL